MKILVTSGGTKIPIDGVRDITNMSSGTFGSKIATELLLMKQEVVFLAAKGSKTPFKVEVDMHSNEWGEMTASLLKKYEQLVWHKERYTELEYRNFNDYMEVLERAIKIYQPDVVILAAAVSDYGVEKPLKGKIRSSEGDLTINLKPLPKVISMVKTWRPEVKLVGFKLLVDSNDEKLIAAAEKSIKDNGCDMVVANSLDDIKDNNHRLYIVYPAPSPQNVLTHRYVAKPEDSNFLARMVAEHATKL